MSKAFMPSIEEQHDDAMFAFSTGDYDQAIARWEAILAEHPDAFDAQLSLGMACYRKGDLARAVAEGHKAERLRPNEPMVHTNLSLFYVKLGNKTAAEHHGLRARVASWKDNMTPAGDSRPESGSDEISMAAPKPQNIKLPTRIPDMPWKKKPPQP
jgi:tetratricopeptide (TPR) repeat protein